MTKTVTAALIGIGGMSGTGKTTLAAALAKAVPNAVHIDSDRTRKEIFGVSETTRLPPEAYAPEVTQRVIDEMGRKTKENLAAGRTVILSATFLSPQARAEQERLAAECGAPFIGLWLRADLKILFDRVSQRVGSASDAGVEIVEMQSKKPPGDIRWAVIDAALPRGRVLAEALKMTSGRGKRRQTKKPRMDAR